MTENEETTKSSLINFFSKPVVGLIGTIASIMGVLLAIYFYLGSRDSRELIYYVHPAKATIVASGAASRLSVKYDNQIIHTDITVAQIAFWNNGKLPIRRNNVLKPFIIQVEKGLQILEVSLRKETRDVIGIAIDKSNLKNGIVSLNWEILEHNDGGIIQIIYAGNTDVRITAKGIIEGQPEIKELKFSGKIESPAEQYSSRIMTLKIFGYLGIFLCTIGSILVFYIWRINRRRDNNNIKKVKHGLFVFYIITYGIAFTLAIYALLKAQIGVPFDF